MMHIFSTPRVGSFTRTLLALIFILSILAACVPFSSVRAQQALNPEQLTCMDARKVDVVLVAPRTTAKLAARPGDVFTVPLTVANSYSYELRGLDITAAVYPAGSNVPVDWFSVGAVRMPRKRRRIDEDSRSHDVVAEANTRPNGKGCRRD